MFSNLSAIKTLVMADASATEDDKANVLRALEGDVGTQYAVSGWRDCEVVSFRDAAIILGYSSARAVHAAVRNGRLKGYYGGVGRCRATGVLTSSIAQAITWVHGNETLG